MTDNINYQLARAIGWPDEYIDQYNGVVRCCVNPKKWKWRTFDHTDPAIADALVERYRLSVYADDFYWYVSAKRDKVSFETCYPFRHRAIALAVIALNKG